MPELKKIISIKNLGRLTNHNAKGDVTFRRLNLIYGQNAHGKTSLTAVFRSLATGSTAPITERTTLGQGQSEVRILSSAGDHTFKNGSWSLRFPDLLVFDATFVSENVFAGEAVDTAQRRRLYEVLIGETNVANARRINEIDAESRRLGTDTAQVEAKIREQMHAPFDLATFLRMQPDPSVNYDEQIAATESQLAASKRASSILQRRELTLLPIPTLPDGFQNLLETSIVELHAEVSAQVANHFKSLGPNGEPWVHEGLQYAAGDKCPFCGQPTSSSELVRAYEAYFSKAHHEHAEALKRLQREVERVLGDDVATRIAGAATANNDICELWADLVDLSQASITGLEPANSMTSVREALLQSIRQKQQSPNTAVELGQEFKAANADFRALQEVLADRNNAIRDANARIAATKKASATSTPSVLEAKLVELKNCKLRPQPEIVKLCGEYNALQKARADLGTEKEKLRGSLDSQTTKLLTAYEGEINRLLGCFGASFRIAGTKASYAGGKASSTYKVSINNVTVAVDSGPGVPGFRCLSSGDRNTLALAFFLAQLTNDHRLSEKIIVIDDPISSFDAFRSNSTEQEIAKLAKKAAQVIVLSHDAAFLHGVYDIADKSTVKCLQFRRAPGTNEIIEWDAERATQSRHSQDHFVLDRYLSGDLTANELLDVARRVRPYLEGTLRMRYPDHFTNKEWLGGFVGKVAAAEVGGALEHLKPDLPALEMVVNYTNPFHHDSNDQPHIVDDELRNHVKLALRLASGGPAT